MLKFTIITDRLEIEAAFVIKSSSSLCEANLACPCIPSIKIIVMILYSGAVLGMALGGSTPFILLLECACSIRSRCGAACYKRAKVRDKVLSNSFGRYRTRL